MSSALLALESGAAASCLGALATAVIVRNRDRLVSYIKQAARSLDIATSKNNLANERRIKGSTSNTATTNSIGWRNSAGRLCDDSSSSDSC